MLKSRSLRLITPSSSARTMRLQRPVSRLPLQATSGTRTSAATTPASHAVSMKERASSATTTPSSATPPSQSVARPAMDFFIGAAACRTLAARGFLDTEFFHAAIEGLAADAELARGLRHDLSVFGEHALDGGAVEHRLVRARRQHRGQVQRRGRDGLLAREQRRALQHV